MQQPFSQTLVAGDTWQWIVSIPSDLQPQGFSVGSFTLRYFFRGPGALDIEAVPDTTGVGQYFISKQSADTVALPVGQYLWQMCLFDGDGNRTEIDRGTVEVAGDIASLGAGGVDPRSHNKRMLDAIERVLEGNADRIEESYQINGRMLKLWDRDKLRKERDTYAWRVRNEAIAEGQLPSDANKIKPSFGYVDQGAGVWR